MALRVSRRIKIVLPAFVASLTTAATVLSVFVSPGASAAPDTPAGPMDVASLQRRLGEVAMDNSLLVDRYDTARVRLALTLRAAERARAAARVAAADYDRARTDMSETAAAQYESGAFSATGALLSSDSGSGYLAQLQTLSMLSTHASQVAKEMADAKSAADAALERADALVAEARHRSDALVRQRADAASQLAKYRAQLTALDPHARWQFERMLVPEVSSATLLKAKVKLALTASPAALKAVRFALAQVGKPYVFGAAGPDSYDCSGLTMMAWAQSGVRLPHSSEVQYTMGKPVPLDQLQPGDLVFLYGPSPAHVTIYAGSGLMVSAPTEGENVSVVPLSAFQSDVVGARRFG